MNTPVSEELVGYEIGMVMWHLLDLLIKQTKCRAIGYIDLKIGADTFGV